MCCLPLIRLILLFVASLFLCNIEIIICTIIGYPVLVTD